MLDLSKLLNEDPNLANQVRWRTGSTFPTNYFLNSNKNLSQPVGKQQQPDSDINLRANSASHANSKAVAGEKKTSKEVFECFPRQVNSFASEGMDMDDSSVQFASSYGAGSSYGASPQYTQVGFPFFHIKTISVLNSNTNPLLNHPTNRSPAGEAGARLQRWSRPRSLRRPSCYRTLSKVSAYLSFTLIRDLILDP